MKDPRDCETCLKHNQEIIARDGECDQKPYKIVELV